jgi:hypothetical protein
MQLLPSQAKLPSTPDRLQLLLLLLLPLMLTLIAGDMQLAGTLHCRNPLLVSSRCSSCDNSLPGSSRTSSFCLCCSILVLADAAMPSGC